MIPAPDVSNRPSLLSYLRPTITRSVLNHPLQENGYPRTRIFIRLDWETSGYCAGANPDSLPRAVTQFQTGKRKRPILPCAGSQTQTQGQSPATALLTAIQAQHIAINDWQAMRTLQRVLQRAHT